MVLKRRLRDNERRFGNFEKGTVDYIGFSYYMSTVESKTQEGVEASGNMVLGV